MVIVDLSLEDGDGMDLIVSIQNHDAKIKVLVISAHDESLFGHRVLTAGASGFINKKQAPKQLIAGIRTLLGGDFYFSQAVMQSMLRCQRGRRGSLPVTGVASLSNRELQVFEHIGRGQSTRQIAEAMFLSVKTIERHKENIKQKLGIDHAAKLAQHATGWVLNGSSERSA